MPVFKTVAGEELPGDRLAAFALHGWTRLVIFLLRKLFRVTG
jgi:hypothetical protein